MHLQHIPTWIPKKGEFTLKKKKRPMKSGYAKDQPRQLNDSCCWTELLNMAGYFSITEKFTRGQERLSSYTQVFFHKRVRKIYLSHGNAQLGPVVSTEPRWISH